MKSHTVHLTMNVPARMDFVNITGDVEKAVADSGVREGLCLVGPWEQIFYGEFDGRRPKRVLVKVVGD